MGTTAVSPEERSAYKERVTDTHQEIKEIRRDLEIEHIQEYKDLVSKYDADRDGVLNSEEWKAGKQEFRETFGEHHTENVELYKVNQEKRQDLLEPPEEPLV